MISKRPVYYTILPSLIIVIGYIWYRRKKNLDTETNKNQKKAAVATVDDSQDNLYSSSSSAEVAVAALKVNNSQPSESLPIENCNSKTFKENRGGEEAYNNKENQSPGSSSSSSSGSSASSLLKSAPIDIAPNPRSPPKRVTEQEIDSEILKLKPGESDIKNLRFIEEPELDSDIDDSPTPADSPLYRTRHFGSSEANKPTSEPVVIKGTMEAKISPENSFRERKYTHTESDECAAAVAANRQDSDKVLQNDDVEVTEVTANTVAIHQNRSSNASQQQQIASPSLSMCSVHSGMIISNYNLMMKALEQKLFLLGDSGQGSSPPQSIGAPSTTYDFLIPYTVIGQIIGSRGNSISKIKEKTGANVMIRRTSYGFRKQRVCSIEGSQSEIDAALKIIRQILPEKRNPTVTLERVFLTPDNQIVPSFNIASLQLKLIEGINNDVSISSVISGGHIFLQQPLHPTFPKLALLQHKMNEWYTLTNAPELPHVIDNAVCAYCIQNNWYRVQIVSPKPGSPTCLVKYLDFGGYSNVNSSELRQIHADFMSLPFQAIECVLSNVRPPNKEEWSQEAAETVLKFTGGVVLQAQVAGYTDDNVPEILLYVTISKDVSDFQLIQLSRFINSFSRF